MKKLLIAFIMINLGQAFAQRTNNFKKKQSKFESILNDFDKASKPINVEEINGSYVGVCYDSTDAQAYPHITVLKIDNWTEEYDVGHGPKFDPWSEVLPKFVQLRLSETYSLRKGDHELMNSVRNIKAEADKNLLSRMIEVNWKNKSGKLGNAHRHNSELIISEIRGSMLNYTLKQDDNFIYTTAKDLAGENVDKVIQVCNFFKELN